MVRKPVKPTSFLGRVRVSFRGIGFAIRSQLHMRIHVFFTILAVLLGLYVGLSMVEWALLSLSIALVVIAECVNTAIEITVDMVTKQYRLRAMLAKDVASGAVTLAAIQAVVVGYLLFFHRFVTLLLSGG